MKLPRMGKPPYMRADHLQNDDLLEIVEEPYVKAAEESRFNRDRGYAVVRLIRTGETFTWGLNGTTWDRLLDAFGDDSALWCGKKVKVKVESTQVRGESKRVIYGMPHREPQQVLKDV